MDILEKTVLLPEKNKPLELVTTVIKLVILVEIVPNLENNKVVEETKIVSTVKNLDI